MADALPDQIGPYRILEILGEGGMGVVYLAEQSAPVRRRVALKLIRLGMDSSEVVARFEAERQALAILDHACIAKVFDGGLSEVGRPYFAMELVDGLPITEYCEEKGLGIPQRLELFAQVCGAIQHAHQKGVIHRDIKPSNVLVTDSDEGAAPKVIDFGVAKATGFQLSEKSLHTGVGQLVGTIEYMSPEQVDLGSSNVDTRTDIYSLGVLLYQLLTGTLPFEAAPLRAAGLAEIQRTIREDEPARPSTRVARLHASGDSTSTLASNSPLALARSLRGELDWIVMKALEKERERRYASAEELRRDVVSFLRGTSVTARPPSLGYQLRVFTRRNRAFVTGTVAVLVTLVAGAFVSLQLYLREQRARTDEAHQRAEAEAARTAEERLRREAETLAQEAQRQRSLAVQQARVADAVVTFLSENLLGAASPDQIGYEYDPDITVSELLDRAARAVGTGSTTDPVVEAAVRRTLGTTYGALGRFEEADRELSRAYEISAQSLGAEHADTLLVLQHRGNLAFDRGDLAEADRLTRQALASYGSAHQDERARIDALRARASLGFVAMAQGQEEEAERLMTETLEQAHALAEADGAESSESRELVPLFASNLSRLFLAQGRLEEAVPLMREALDGFERSYGMNHPSALTAMSNLAALYNSMRRFDEAGPLLLRVLETQREILGEDHPDTLTTLNNYGFNQKAQGRLEEARGIYLDALDRRVAALGPEHPHVLASLSNVGTVQRELGDLDASAETLTESLERHLAVLGPDHRDTQYSRLDLATTRAAQGDLAAATDLLEAAARGARVGMPGDPAFAVGCWMRRGQYLQQLDRDGEAADSLLRAAEMGAEKLGTDHRLTRNSITTLVSVLRELGDDETAAEWEARL